MPFENQPYPWSRDSVVENAHGAPESMALFRAVDLHS